MHCHDEMNSQEWEPTSEIKYMPFKKGYKMSEDHKKRIGDANRGKPAPNRKYWLGKKRPAMAGKNNPAWKGGVTTKNEMFRRSTQYYLWRESVFKRDNYTCIWCGARCGNGKKVILHADHIKPFTFYPELRLAIDNGRTLCEPCHRTTDTWGGRVYNKQ